MRITKNQAEQIAKSLLSKKREDIDQTEKNLKEYVNTIAEISVPEGVKQFAKIYPEYLRFEEHIRVSCKEIGLKEWKWIPVNKAIPVVRDSGDFINVSEEAYKHFEKTVSDLNTLEDEYKKSFYKVRDAIYNLRTPARLAKEFPEAAAFLPEANQVTALSVNIDSIRDLIK